MEQLWRVVVYRFLAVLGIFIVLFLPLPLSIATLFWAEPLLLIALLTVWFSSYYLRATLAKGAAIVKASPVLRGHFQGHPGTADFLKIIVLAGSPVFVWIAWSSEPFRIFNATLLGIVWGFLEMVNSLMSFRRLHTSFGA